MTHTHIYMCVCVCECVYVCVCEKYTNVYNTYLCLCMCVLGGMHSTLILPTALLNTLHVHPLLWRERWRAASTTHYQTTTPCISGVQTTAP